MTTTWDPTQYDKFKAQRSKPFYDLLSLVQSSPMDFAVDLGCGTGQLTRALFDRLSPKRMTGVDSSKEMLSRSQAHEASGLVFELKDISAFEPDRPIDLLFSNAALHWLPRHEELFPRLLGRVKSGGQVAVQMPSNFDHPSHTTAKSVAAELFPDSFLSGPTGDAEVSGTLRVDRYAEILFENGFEEPVCRVEVYGHPMSSGDEVIEWTKGTLLTAYQKRLSEEQFARFLEAYRHRLLEKIGKGPYFYAFKRILLWGRKKRSIFSQ